MPIFRFCWAVMLLLFAVVSGTARAADPPAVRAPLLRAIELNVGESTMVELSDGSQAAVKLLELRETRDPLREAVRQALVTVEINGQRAELTAAMYNLPQTVGRVQIDCPVTRGYQANPHRDGIWNLARDVRLRLWPAGSPLIEPGTFGYPVRQRWFASDTQMANDPCYVDGGERPDVRKIYYHYGLDIGGSEGMVEVIAATAGLVVSVGDSVLEGHKDTPVDPRYDVVYLLDDRGWYYRYSHLQSIDDQIKPGRVVNLGQKLGVLGKEGGSGGWSHLHFDIFSHQPSGKWGVQEGYGFLWEAYQRQFKPELIAVARPHHLAAVGEAVRLDAGHSWARSGRIASYRWTFHDGSQADGAVVLRTYERPGTYSEILEVKDDAGNVDYDFAVVQVLDKKKPDELPPSIHANYSPTFQIHPGDEVTFKVRTFRAPGGETWNFGDGSPQVEVKSDGNAEMLAKDGYSVTTHRYAAPGHYLVTVFNTAPTGLTATAHLHVLVEP